MARWRVAITQGGRSGSLTYHEGRDCIPLQWEFGGGDVVAIICAGDARQWEERHPWASRRRREILERVANEVLRQQAPGCEADIRERIHSCPLAHTPAAFVTHHS
jgi:hypothetical protein